MYPRSGFRSRGTCERTLVPVFVLGSARSGFRSGGTSAKTTFLGKNHPFVSARRNPDQFDYTRLLKILALMGFYNYTLINTLNSLEWGLPSVIDYLGVKSPDVQRLRNYSCTLELFWT